MNHPCMLLQLPAHLQIEAARTAAGVHPANRPALHRLAETPLIEPQHLALLTTKYWGPQPRVLSVSFLEGTPTELATRILGHMNAWGQRCCVRFAPTSGHGNVRISRGRGGYWSYLGTDIMHAPAGEQTMNLEGFTMATPESEYHRVVRHETGHTLGFPHEHMRRELVARIDPAKAVAYFARTQGWGAEMVAQQVLTPLDDRSMMETPPDQTSIMCYQLPGTITRDGKPIVGGTDINESDYQFAAKLYPTWPAAKTGDDWPDAKAA